MAETTVNLGMLPQNRGEYSSSATYYKDNIVQYNGSSYICTAAMDLEHPSGITGVAPYDSDPATPNTGWAVFSNDSSGVGEGVYNVSVDHTTDNQPKVYANLSAALNDIPAAKQKGGMSIKFIQGTVQSSDNKYVQYRYIGTATTGSPNPFLNTKNWALCGDDYKTGLINVTLEYPLASGQFYQISDATAANYAPAVIPVYRRVQGCILKIEVSSLNYQLFKFNGAANVSASWLAANRWVRILDENDKNELIKKSDSIIYNLTKNIPLESGYYQFDDAGGDNYAPSAVPSEIRLPGIMIIIQVSEFRWDIYQYDSYNNAGFQLPNRWKCISRDSQQTIITATPIGDQQLQVSFTDQLYNGFSFGLLIPKAMYVYIQTLNGKQITRPDGTSISLTDMRTVGKVYNMVYANDKYILCNPDDTYDIDLSNIVSKSLINDLEVGYISTNGLDGNLNTRLRTRAGLWYKTPLRIKVNDGYVLNSEITLDLTTNTTTLISKTITGIYDIPSDNLLRRFVFRKSNNTAFTEVEDVASIVFSDDYKNLKNKPSVNGVLLDGNVVIPTVDEDILSLENTETLLLVGTSHTEGNGSLKDKSMASYLSVLSDWNVMNLGYSGSNYIKHLYYLLNDTELTGSKWSDVKTGGICLDFLCGGAENIYAQAPMDGKYSAENMKRLYSLIMSKGFDIVAGSYWGDDALSISDIQKKVAMELGLDTFDINNDLYRINDKEFLPYWYNAHFATRTVANQFFTLMQKYNLRRPRKAIKVYRNRVSGVSNDSLLYNNAFERLEKWRELSVGHRAIADGKENYVDRLDLYIENYLLSTVASEYTSLRKKEAISFSDKALIEFILPFTAYNVHDLKLYISTSATNASVYIRKYQDASLAIPISPASAVFIISGDASGISDGDVFTDTLNSGVTFTVTNVDVQTGRIMCTASGSFVTPGQTTDTLTRISDSQEFTATSLTSGVPAGYLDEATSAHGKWEAITKTEDSYVIANPSLYMEYDKIAILIDNNGSGFTIDDVYATYVKGLEKSVEPTVVEQYPVVSGTSIFEDKFVNSVGVLDNTHGSYIWDGNESYVNGSGVTVTKNHIPPYYNSKGATRILHLKKGDKISYDINGFAAQTQADGVHDYRLTIVCRYFPASNLDVNAATFTVTPNTFDFSKLGIKYNVGWSAVFTDERYVPASFVELHKDIHFDGIHTGNSLELIAVEDDVEILYVKMEKIS